MPEEIKEIFGLIKRKKQTMAVIVILMLIIAVIFTFVQPLKYGAASRLLVVQNFPLGADPFAISRSNEFISNVLTTAVSSNIFYRDVISSGYNIDEKYFSAGNAKAEMRQWRKTVQAKAVGDSGIIEINAYHPDKQQLDQIAAAVNFILQSRHQQYHGLGGGAVVKVIDKPILSDWPVKPNVVLNLSLALAAGLIAAFYYIYFFPNPEYDVRSRKRRAGAGAGEERLSTPRQDNFGSFSGSLDFQAEPAARNENYQERDNLELPFAEEAERNEISRSADESEEKDIPLEGSMDNIFGRPNRSDY